jgi:hypothetical protein
LPSGRDPICCILTRPRAKRLRIIPRLCSLLSQVLDLSNTLFLEAYKSKSFALLEGIPNGVLFDNFSGISEARTSVWLRITWVLHFTAAAAVLPRVRYLSSTIDGAGRWQPSLQIAGITVYDKRTKQRLLWYHTAYFMLSHQTPQTLPSETEPLVLHARKTVSRASTCGRFSPALRCIIFEWSVHPYGSDTVSYA